MLLAYTYPGINRETFLAELQRHADQDRVVQGGYPDKRKVKLKRGEK